MYGYNYVLLVAISTSRATYFNDFRLDRSELGGALLPGGIGDMGSPDTLHGAGGVGGVGGGVPPLAPVRPHQPSHQGTLDFQHLSLGNPPSVS